LARIVYLLTLFLSGHKDLHDDGFYHACTAQGREMSGKVQEFHSTWMTEFTFICVYMMNIGDDDEYS